MNYEQKYKEALENFKIIKNANKDNKELVYFIECEYPELRESEDEKIRKEIIQSIQDNMCVIHKDKCIAWLEKQGERKVTESEEDEKIRKAAIAFVKASDHFGYHLGISKENVLAWLEKQGEQDIIDLKEYAKGILKGAATHLMIWIDENLADGNMCLSNMECEDLEDAMVNAKWDKIYNYIKKKVEKQNKKKPDNKVEPKFKIGDTIKYIGEREGFSKEKHTIKKILDDCYLTIDDVYIPFKFEEYYILVNQKSAWSEEDDIRFNQLIGFIQKYGLQYYASIDKVIDFIHWLKSFKPQNRWKPSEEQMEALKKRTYGLHTSSETRKALESLIDDLKTL